MTKLISLNCLKSFAWVFFNQHSLGFNFIPSPIQLFNFFEEKGGNVNQLPCACFVIVHFTFVVVGGWTVQCICILLLVLVIYVEGTVEHLGLGFMVFNATFNNISVMSWLSVLLVGGNRRQPPTCCKSLTNFII